MKIDSLTSAAFLAAATLTPTPTPVTGASEGVASYYHDSLHGNPTASGAPYDKGDYTAAHRKLPFGTRVRVVNLENNRSVLVEVTDRGPFVKGRIIDLSRRAAKDLGIIKEGVANVRIEVLGK